MASCHCSFSTLIIPRRHDMKFLLDANLSPETADFLRRLFFDAKSLIEMGLGGLDDEEVIRLAREEGRAVITFDLDFGEIFYFSDPRQRGGAIVLRLEDQRVENVNAVLEAFLDRWKSKKNLKTLGRKLIILEQDRFRIIS